MPGLLQAARGVRQAHRPVHDHPALPGGHGGRHRERAQPGLQVRLAGDTGKPYHVEATMAGLYASQMALDAATVGMEIFGGYGVTMEADIQRYWRDSQQMVFSPISNEMSKNFIAQCYGLPKSF